MKKFILFTALFVSLIFIRNISAAENIPLFEGKDINGYLESYSSIRDNLNSGPQIIDMVYVDKEEESGYAVKLKSETVLPVIILSHDKENIQSIGISCRLNNKEDLFTAADFLFINLKILTAAEDPEILFCLNNMLMKDTGGTIYSSLWDRTYYLKRHKVNDKLEVIAFTATR